MDDSIEIHFDEKRGQVELACGEEAFKKIRDFIANELAGLPEIPWDKVTTIELLDTAKFGASRDSRKNNLFLGGCLFLVAITMIVSVIGAATILGWLHSKSR